jgi:hypothetical protein
MTPLNCAMQVSRSRRNGKTGSFDLVATYPEASIAEVGGMSTDNRYRLFIPTESNALDCDGDREGEHLFMQGASPYVIDNGGLVLRGFVEMTNDQGIELGVYAHEEWYQQITPAVAEHIPEPTKPAQYARILYHVSSEFVKRPDTSPLVVLHGRVENHSFDEKDTKKKFEEISSPIIIKAQELYQKNFAECSVEEAKMVVLAVAEDFEPESVSV